MMTRKFLFAAGAIILLSAFTVSTAINWKIKEDYSIKFSGTSVEGIFKDLSGDILFDDTEVQNSTFSFSVDVKSINTGNGTKNKHAVSKKWFDADQFPTITFASTSVSKAASGYEVTGDMQIHGVTKQMTIPFTFTNNTFYSSFSVKRMDFGVGTMKGMSKKVSDKIDIEVSIPVTK